MQKFSYDEPLDQIEWDLTGDTLTIDVYLCNSASLEYVRKEISENIYKNISLLDVKAVYKFLKLYKLTLNVNNIFDNRSYSYTVFNGLDIYSYDYTLRPRQITLSISVTL